MIDEKRYKTTERHSITLKKRSEALSVLDIGGGGEGFIGDVYQRQCIAIDKRADELSEINNDAVKLVMDGVELSFLDDSFELVTLFYSLMYMSHSTKEKVLKEAVRVLKSKGIIEIWGVDVPIYDGQIQDVFLAQLEVTYKDNVRCTGYGISLDHEYQTINTVLDMLKPLEVEVNLQSIDGIHFYITAIKN